MGGYECFRSVQHAVFHGSEISDLSAFQEVKSLELCSKHHLFLLKNIPELTLVSSASYGRKQVLDISHLTSIRITFDHDIIKIADSNLSSQLRYLKLINCDQFVKIVHGGKTSIFQHLQFLHITSSLIEHVNGLGDIPHLILQGCLKLRDIRSLGRNKCVELSYCPKIRDVRSLVTVPIVTIKNCIKIVDYSCLSSVPRLRIVR